MFIQKKLPSVEEVRSLAPITDDLAMIKSKLDEQLKQNFISKERFVVVCGPCAADDVVAVSQYLKQLSTLSEKYPRLLVVARVYTTKPRSNGQGYKGMCFMPNGEIDIVTGLVNCRKMMLESIQNGLPVADELLYPDLYPYFADLVSYWFVGARSSEDSLHRDFASGLDCCVGVKNATDGNIIRAVDSLYAVSHPSSFVLGDNLVSTQGCKMAHLVLRGGSNGEQFSSNLDEQSVFFATTLLQQNGLSSNIMVDISHANSAKIALNQIENAATAAKNPNVFGIMAESYLFAGCKTGQFGVSKTDDCLSFADTERLFDIVNYVLATQRK